MTRFLLAAALLAITLPLQAQPASVPSATAPSGAPSASETTPPAARGSKAAATDDDTENEEESADQGAKRRLTARRFTRAVATGNLIEIEWSKIAIEKASSADIKAFAQALIDERSKASEELKAIAPGGRRGWPGELRPKQAQSIEKLRALNSQQFERRYRTRQVRSHERAIKLFEDYAANGDNADLKKWAQDRLPKLRESLDKARALAGR